MNGFDDFDTQVTAEEFYEGWTEDEADYQTPVQPSGDEMYEGRFEDHMAAWGHCDPIDEDHMAQYDDDPNPYAGTYSEE